MAAEEITLRKADDNEKEPARWQALSWHHLRMTMVHLGNFEVQRLHFQELIDAMVRAFTA